MSVALDLGTASIKSLRREGPRLIFRQTPSLYAIVPHSQDTIEKLQANQFPYACCQDELILLGESVQQLDDPLKILSLFPDGFFRSTDILERQILAKTIDAVLPAPRKLNEICCINLPGGRDQTDPLSRSNEHFFLNLVELRGYQPLYCTSGMAIILSECETSAYTGLGISFGKHQSHVSLLKNGRQIKSCTISVGGHWLDRKLSQDPSLLANYWKSGLSQSLLRVEQERESFTGSLLVPVTLYEQVLSDLTQELLNVVMQELQRLLQGQSYEKTITTAIPLVCAGGLTLMNDFMPLLQMLWEKYPLPFEISSFRRARHPICCVSQGCLINAELETLATQQQGAA